MHIGSLTLAAILTLVLNRYRLATAGVGIVVHTNDLPVVLRGKESFVLATDVDTLMELRPAVVHRVTTVAERRGYKHELIPFQRKGIKTVGSGLCRDGSCRSDRHIPLAVVCGTNPLAFPLSLFHHHLVILLEIGTLDDTNDGIDIVPVRGIATSLDGSSPSPVVVRRKIPGVFLIALSHEYLAVVLKALADIIILLELLVGPVIIRKYILSIELALHTEMVVGGPGEHALSIGRLDDALRKGDRCRYAISAHLLHGMRCIPVNIILS